MKKMLSGLIIILGLSTLMAADFFIKEETHTDSYYYGGVVRPSSDSTEEIWFGENKMAYKTAGRTVIIDEKSNMISILFHNSKTYIQSPLPMDMTKLLPQQLIPMLQARQTVGKISETSNTKKINKWDSRCYKIDVDQPFALEINTWCTTDVPFDWKKLNNMFANVRRLANYSEAYIQSLETIKGYGIQTDVTVFLQGSSFQIKSRTVEISQKNPPSDTYTIPSEYTKKEQLTIQDLRTR